MTPKRAQEKPEATTFLQQLLVRVFLLAGLVLLQVLPMRQLMHSDFVDVNNFNMFKFFHKPLAAL